MGSIDIVAKTMQQQQQGYAVGTSRQGYKAWFVLVQQLMPAIKLLTFPSPITLFRPNEKARNLESGLRLEKKKKTEILDTAQMSIIDTTQ